MESPILSLPAESLSLPINRRDKWFGCHFRISDTHILHRGMHEEMGGMQGMSVVDPLPKVKNMDYAFEVLIIST